MLRALVVASLRQPILVLGLAAVLMAAGFYRLRDAPMDVFPEFAPPLIEVQTEAPGLSTDEVESLITVPIENALHGVGHVKTLRSKSVLGLSSVVLLFKPGIELPAVRQQVQERLAALAPDLPKAAKAPVILSPLSSTRRLL
jgi:Cu/Ag efflux pump CusA